MSSYLEFTLTPETGNKVEGGNFRFCPKRVNAKISSRNKQTRVKTNKTESLYRENLFGAKKESLKVQKETATVDL